MLLGLTIRDVVLIDRLALAFRPGLCALTGETGAGKSILLDALGLALGRRADASLVRPGAEQAAVAAEFAAGGNHPATATLDKAATATGLSRTIDLRRLAAAARRRGEAISDAIGEIDGDAGAQRALARALRRLERVRDRAQGLLDGAIAAGERASAETAEAATALAQAAQALELDPQALDQVEERLFALRALARKHGIAVADLPRLHQLLTEQLGAIESGADIVLALEQAAAAARERYIAAAAAVTRAREAAARRLDKAIEAELKPLRLEKA